MANSPTPIVIQQGFINPRPTSGDLCDFWPLWVVPFLYRLFFLVGLTKVTYPVLPGLGGSGRPLMQIHSTAYGNEKMSKLPLRRFGKMFHC